MPALQVTIDTSTPDTLEAACFACGAQSVTLLDADDNPILEPAVGSTPLWPRVRLLALYPQETEASQVRHALEASLGESLPELRFEVVEDRAWEREWLKDFRPMRFGTRLWVCPHDQPPPQRGAVALRLDPGLAFGTGTHETTAMCLTWLDSAELRGLDVLDYGSGSGILAIAALLLGARYASALDIDPQALLATRENARRNGVEGSLEVLSADDPAPLADILIANILAQPLIDLAPVLKSLVRRRGVAVLSGILASQATAVASAYAPWFDMRPFATRNDWVCLEGVRR